jgi:ankyrin repeat protein
MNYKYIFLSLLVTHSFFQVTCQPGRLVLFTSMITTFREGMERDKESWSQETLDTIKSLLGQHLPEELSANEFKPLHLILNLCDKFTRRQIEPAIKELIKLDHPLIDLNAVDNEGNSVLHCAVIHMCYDTIELLGSYPNVNLEVTNKQNATPLEMITARLVIQDRIQDKLQETCKDNGACLELIHDLREELKASQEDLEETKRIFRSMLLLGVHVDLQNKLIVRLVTMFFGRFPLYHAIIEGNIRTVKLLIDGGCNSCYWLFVCQDDSLRGSSLEYAAAQGHYDIVKMFTSNDAWLKDERAQDAIKKSCIIVENILARLKFMLEQPKLTDETKNLYQERKENYEAIRSRLRATLRLPLECLREYCDEQRTDRIARFNMPNELLYLIGFFLFDAWTYTNLLTKSK